MEIDYHFDATKKWPFVKHGQLTMDTLIPEAINYNSKIRKKKIMADSISV